MTDEQAKTKEQILSQYVEEHIRRLRAFWDEHLEECEEPFLYIHTTASWKRYEAKATKSLEEYKSKCKELKEQADG